MATQEATDTLSAISEDIKGSLDAGPGIEVAVDDREILAVLDDDSSGGHLLRNLALLLLAATVVGAVVAVVLRGRR
jgi:hypothetical protein